MEVENTCKHCNCIIEDNSFICTDKTFTELVNECKNKKQDECEIKIDNNIKLGKSGVIKWLLENATPEKIDPDNINEIIDKCVYSSEADMIEILKTNHVYVKITKENEEEEEEEDEYWDVDERCALEDAVKIGNSEIITWLLKLRINDNCAKSELNPYVIQAVEANRLDNLQTLVELGAQVYYSSCNGNKNSVLEVAAKYGHMNIVKWIFDNNLASNSHISCIIALHKSVEHKRYDILEYLIEIVKVNINNTYSKETILHKAAKLKNLNLIKWLVEKGATLLIKDTHGNDITDIAVTNKNMNLLKWLVGNQGVDLMARKNRSYTLLNKAVMYKNIDCIKYLIHKGCDINETNNYDNKSVLHCAVESGNIEYVKLLIAHGANVNVVDNDKNTLLHSAKSNLEILQYLLPMGIDIYAKNKENNNILELAAHRNDATVVKWLLELGMDINDVLKQSYWWLQASYDRYYSNNKVPDNTMLKLCISYMKNIDQELNESGYTLLLSAAEYPEAVEIILEHKPNVNVSDKHFNHTVLMRSLTDKDKDCKSAYKLIEAGANVMAKGKYGETVLHCAIKTKNIEFIKKLIALGVDIKTSENNSNSVLNKAISTGNMSLIKLLVESGANVNYVECNGCIRSCHRLTRMPNWNITKYLIENGANPNRHTSYSDPLLFTAIEMQDLDLVLWLLDHGADPNNTRPTENSIIHHCWLSFKDEYDDRQKCIKLLLNHNANINGLNNKGKTLLFNVLNDLEMMDFLIKNGINLNIQDKNGCTVLHIALQAVNFEKDSQHYNKVVFKLIHNGININIVNKKGQTPLHLAASIKHCSDIATMLVQRGANVNAKDLEGNSVLHYTCQGDVGMWLCEKGADINAKNDKGMSVLQSFIKRLPDKTLNTKLNIVPLLQTRALNLNTNNNATSQSLITSIESSRYMNFLKILVTKNDNVEESGHEGMTAMHYAVVKDNVFLVQLLLQKRVNILNKSGDGNTVLHSAASAGSLSVVTYILEHMKHELLLKGNNVNDTPLHLAVISNHVNIVKLLLKHGVEVDHKNNKNMTALHLACKHGNLEIVKLLLSNGANLYETCTNLYTPIHMAIQHCKFHVFEYLLQFESQNPNFESNVELLDLKTDLDENLLHVAAKFGRLRNVPTKIMQYLINKQVYPIDSVDKLGNSALHYACSTYVIDAVKLLVNNGANINLKNKTGNTPFHFAGKSAREDIIKFLLENGGNAKAKNHKGNTPIHMVAAHDKKSQIINHMVEMKADYYIKNRKGNTPLHQIAACEKSYRIRTFHDQTTPYRLDIVNNKKQTPLHIGLKTKQYGHIEELLNSEVVNIVDIHGNTPLHVYLITLRDYKKVSLPINISSFLRCGADLSIQNKNEDTPMHIALINLKPSEIKYMLKDLNINIVNIKNKNGENLLHTALYRMDLDTIQEIFKYADYNAKTDMKENYLHIALENPYFDVIEWIVPICKSMINEKDIILGDTVLLKCVRENIQIDIVKLLIDNGADINATDTCNTSILHISCSEVNTELIHYLIDIGINMNVAEVYGYTALHYAVREKLLNINIIKKLIVNGANVNAVTNNGETVLHIAARYDNIVVVKYLILEVHCDFKLKCNDGLTAYQLAKENGKCPNVVFWMLNNNYL